jgi:hypothetical protein
MRKERPIDSAIRKALLRQTGDAASSCPDENALSAYLERSLPDPERLRLESHFSDCASCRELLALSMRITADEPAAVESPIRRPQERKLLSPSRVPLAVVAALVLGIGATVVFLLTSEFRKGGRVEVAEQRAPAAAPAAGEMVAPSKGTSIEPPKPAAGPATTGARGAQTAMGQIDTGHADTAQERESRTQQTPSRPAYPGTLELKRQVSDTDKIALNEAASGQARVKDESRAVAAATQLAGEAAGATVGGVVAGAQAPAKPAEERTAEGALEQTAAVSVGSSSARSEALNEPARLTLKSRRAVPASASLRWDESGLHDVLQRAAADEKAGRAVQLPTRVIGGRTFRLFGGSWIDLKVLDHPDADLAVLAPGSPELGEIVKALPDIGRLRQNGQSVLLDWKGRNCVIR